MRRWLAVTLSVALATATLVVAAVAPAAASSVPGTPGTPTAIGMPGAVALRWSAPGNAGIPPATSYRIEKNDGSGWTTATSAPDIRSIAAGGDHSCALLSTGVVKCWGADNLGQLGYGDTTARGDGAGEMGDNLPAVDLGTGRTATAISSARNHTCALLDNTTVKCWGNGNFGQLGQGDTNDRGDQPNEMGDNLPAINLGTGRTAVAISAGNVQTCALLDDRERQVLGQQRVWPARLRRHARPEATRRRDGRQPPAVNLGTGRTAVAIAAAPSTDVCAPRQLDREVLGLQRRR